jgi:hypothetical protein
MTAENVGGQLHHQQIYIPAAAHGTPAMPFGQPVQHSFMSGGLSNAQALVHSAAVVSPSSSTSSSAAPSPMKMVYGGAKAATVVEDEDESGSSSSSEEASSSSEDEDEEELLPDLIFPEGLPPNALALMQEASRNQPENPDELAQLVAPLIEQDVATELVTASAVVLITPLLARERAAAAAGEPRSNRGYDSSGKLAVSVSPPPFFANSALTSCVSSVFSGLCPKLLSGGGWQLRLQIEQAGLIALCSYLARLCPFPHA